MSTDVRCEVTELLVDQCAHCRSKPVVVQRSDAFIGASGLGPWFAARYDGRCSKCGDLFWEGERIRADGDGGYLCEECGSDDDDL